MQAATSTRGLRIATEEAFATPALMAAWREALAGSNVEPGFALMGASILAPTAANAVLHARLLDVGVGRLEQMDAAGIDMQILSLTSPGVQVLPPALATSLAAQSNDILAAAVATYPTRLAGLGAVAPQEPEAAAQEIARMRGLGLKGVIINSHTFGQYLDEPHFLPILESAAAENLPIYLHPREPPPAMIAPFTPYGLYFATYGFAVETGLHALRLILSGVFDRLPKLNIVLGHLGEGLPFWLDRIDNRHALQVRIGAAKPLLRTPSAYFHSNFFVTTAGMNYASPLRLCLDKLDHKRILFAADYPYEDHIEAVQSLDSMCLDDTLCEAIFSRNAVRVFDLPLGKSEHH